MMKILASYNHSVILNYGIANNKQSGLVILPANLTKGQISTYQELKKELSEEYDSITSCAIPSEPLKYKGDLKLMSYEDQIEGIKLSDVDSLYNEINNHIERLEKMEKINESNNSQTNSRR